MPIRKLESKYRPANLDPPLNLLQFEPKSRLTNNGPKFRFTIIQLKFTIPSFDRGMLSRNWDINDPDITRLIPSNLEHILFRVVYHYERFLSLGLVFVAAQHEVIAFWAVDRQQIVFYLVPKNETREIFLADLAFEFLEIVMHYLADFVFFNLGLTPLKQTIEMDDRARALAIAWGAEEGVWFWLLVWETYFTGFRLIIFFILKLERLFVLEKFGWICIFVLIFMLNDSHIILNSTKFNLLPSLENKSFGFMLPIFEWPDYKIYILVPILPTAIRDLSAKSFHLIGWVFELIGIMKEQFEFPTRHTHASIASPTHRPNPVTWPPRAHNLKASNQLHPLDLTGHHLRLLNKNNLRFYKYLISITCIAPIEEDKRMLKWDSKFLLDNIFCELVVKELMTIFEPCHSFYYHFRLCRRVKEV